MLLGGLLVCGGTYAYTHWDDIVVWWSGKRLAILGPRASGKSTLITFLTKGTIQREYTPTGAKASHPSVRKHFGDLELKLKSGFDVGGDALRRNKDWKGVAETSDVLLYLFSVEDLTNSTYRENMLADTKAIGTWIQAKEISPEIVIMVGTFCDKILGYTNLYSENQIFPNEVEEFRAEVLVDKTIKKSRLALGGTSKVNVVLGSLADSQNAERLVLTLLSSVIHK
jgi:GTPase SAR1 family protein